MKATTTQTLVVFSLIALVIVAFPGQFLHIEPQWLRMSVGISAFSLLIVDWTVIWSAPNTALGLLLAPFYGFSRPSWNGRSLSVVTKRNMLFNPKGQAFGLIKYFRTEFDRGYWDTHEEVHVDQARLWGPVMLVAYPMNYLYNLAKYRNHWEAYRNIWFEKKARDSAGH